MHNKNYFDSDKSIFTSSDSENEDEIKFLKNITQNSRSIFHVYKILCLIKTNSVFPKLFTAVKIGITLPVSSSSTERSFSKLNLVKTRLNTNISETRLEGLMKISCAQD